MNRDSRMKFILCTALEGALEELLKSEWVKHIPPKAKQHYNAARSFLKTANKEVGNTVSSKDLKLLLKEVNQYDICVLPKGFRFSDRAEVFTVADYAMVNCYDCQKDTCELRSALEKLNMPRFNESVDGCPFKIETGRRIA